MGYGLSVSCSGTGFLPLSAQITLQEEHLGTWYEDVDSPGIVPLTEGGYGFVRGEAYCNHDNSGHDYRVKAVIYAGNHTGRGRSREVHLPCNL
ncbi:hypothetical protein JDV76_01905 [Corynebacterium sp. CCM 8864]|uniref:Uncharacterized protein n=1 Tax=Corynebacterium marambiense TaxID=2765364 RepID=A0ABS0VSH5_9CORY|nr:hypothetical protein [Corynebacterium marambiense]